MADHSTPRLILLFGTPRSGTSWLGTILSSHPRCLYSHEPTTKETNHYTRHLVQLSKSGQLLDKTKIAEVISSWCKAYHGSNRPPFFSKSFSVIPPKVQWSAWILARCSFLGKSAYCALFSPKLSANFDLVVKEVGWERHAEQITRNLNGQLIVIVRHPCGVVASQLKGRKNSWLTPPNVARWYKTFVVECTQLGFSERAVMLMQPHEFCALRWLVANEIFADTVDQFPKSQMVIYERLCADPLGVTEKIFAKLGWKTSAQTKKFISDSCKHHNGKLHAWFRGKRPYFDVYKNSQQSMNSWRQNLPIEIQESILRIARKFKHFSSFWNSPR
jgi:hypothetical protein